MVSLRALECFVAVADSGSITEAARLLQREPRGVTLTEAGRAALADARKAVDAASSAIRSAREAERATGGIIRLACAQSLTVPLLAPAIRQWSERFPDVAFAVHESTSRQEILDLVDSGEADAGLLPGPAPGRFTSFEIAEEEVVLATYTGHPLAQQGSATLSDLEGQPLIHFDPENGLSTWLDQSLARAGVRPEIVMRTSITATAPQLAAAGLGISVCPVSAITAGYPGAVRSFSPRWVRQLVAVTSGTPEPLLQRFLDDIRGWGVRVPRDIRAQLVPADDSAPNGG